MDSLLEMKTAETLYRQEKIIEELIELNRDLIDLLTQYMEIKAEEH